MRESLRFEYNPKREYCFRLDTSYHELRTACCLSVPEKASCIPMLQSTAPPWVLQLDVLIAQTWLLRQTKADFPFEQEPQPSRFQYRFWSLPFLNSRTYRERERESITDMWDKYSCLNTQLESYQSKAGYCISAVTNKNGNGTSRIFPASKCNHESHIGSL